MAQNWSLEELKKKDCKDDLQRGEQKRQERAAKTAEGKLGRQLKTGEVEVLEEGKIAYRKRVGFVMVSKTQYFSTWDNFSYYTTFTNPVASTLSTAESRILQYLCQQSYWYNWQLYQRTVICTALELNPSTVTRSIAKLESLGLIYLQSAKTGKAETPSESGNEPWYDSDLTRASYRELVWAEWKALTGAEVIPNRVSWLRVSNSIMWKGQPMYMYKPAAGIAIENRSGVYKELQEIYGQEPGVLFALQDEVRKGKTMAGYWDAVTRRETRVLPEGRW